MVTIDIKKLYIMAKNFEKLKGDNCCQNNILLDPESNTYVSFARIGFCFSATTFETHTLNMMIIKCQNDIEYRIEFESEISCLELYKKLSEKIQMIGCKLKKQYSTVATTAILTTADV